MSPTTNAEMVADILTKPLPNAWLRKDSPFIWKQLADEFNEFLTSVRAKAAEESEKLAAEYNLPLIQPKTPVLIHETDEFHFHPVHVVRRNT